MSAQNYKIDQTQAKMPTPAAQMLNLLENINQSFASLLLIRAQMIQQKDGTAGDATDWVTVSKNFGFVDAGGTISSSVAMAAFAEMDSFNTNGGPSLQQCCARFKQ